MRISSLELERVRERVLERQPVDRDLRRQVRLLLEEPEQVGVVGVLVLDDDRDVLEPRASSGGSESSARRTCSSKVTSPRVAHCGCNGSLFLTSCIVSTPNDEAADVREERDAAARRRRGDRERAVQRLQHDPEAEEEDRGHLAEDEEEPEEDRRQHARAREQHEVRAEHAGDRAARADVRDARVLRGAEVEA